MKATRCKRCGVWVNDGSPMCPACMSRHYEVYYNLKMDFEDEEKFRYEESKKTPWLGVILIIVLFVGIGLGILTLNLGKDKLDFDSFPANGQVYVYDVLKYERRDPCPIKVFSDREKPSYIEWIDLTDESVVYSVFLHPNTNYAFYLPEGSYRVHILTGKKWENILQYFGSQTEVFFKQDALSIVYPYPTSIDLSLDQADIQKIQAVRF